MTNWNLKNSFIVHNLRSTALEHLLGTERSGLEKTWVLAPNLPAKDLGEALELL